MRLITRGGYDWTKRYPWIVEAALKNRQKHFVIDGEAVILGVDGVSDFNALHSGKHNEEVQLCAFDVLAIDGDDLRSLPLSMRRPTPLARIAYVKLMTAALRTSRCIDRGVSSRNMGRLVRVMPRRRLEKAVNKVAADTSNLWQKALPVGLGAFITRPGEGCDGQTEALAGTP